MFEPIPIITIPGDESPDLVATAMNKCNENFGAIGEAFTVTESLVSGALETVSNSLGAMSGEVASALETMTGEVELALSTMEGRYAQWASDVATELGDDIALEVDPDLLEANYIPDSYTPTVAPSCNSVEQLTAHLKGINDKLASLEARLNAHGI